MAHADTPDARCGPRASTAEIAELRRWLARNPPQVPPKYFYDERGSDLFEAITRTDEYYPTRTESAILRRHARAIIRDLAPREIAELGAGSSVKTRAILDAFRDEGSGRHVRLFDISGEFLEQSAAVLRKRYPTLRIETVVGDFQRDLAALGPGGRRLLVFLGGTLGNLDEGETRAFLASIADVLADDDAFLLGVDLVKSRAVLEAAYDDEGGVTAAFNLNMLEVLNARFGADFDPADFEHRAQWNPAQERVEIWLDAVRPTKVHVAAAGVTLRFSPGEGLRTEISRKFTRTSLTAALREAGLELDRWLTDDDATFALALIRPSERDA